MLKDVPFPKKKLAENFQSVFSVSNPKKKKKKKSSKMVFNQKNTYCQTLRALNLSKPGETPRKENIYSKYTPF